MTSIKTSCRRQLVITPWVLAVIVMISTPICGQEKDQKDGLANAISSGEFVFNGKLRFWHANDDAASASQAYTFGTNFGYLTKAYKGFQIYIEGESVVALTPDDYFDGLNGLTDLTNVTDPETLELNQMYISYKDAFNDKTELEVKVGRQAAIVEDERFIGRVSARQDDQTFDALYGRIQNDQKGLAFEYAYMYQINRLLAEEVDWRSDSHVFMLRYYKNKKVRFGLFTHLLDFQDDAPSVSNQTYGITIDRGALPKDKLALNYKTAFAYQSDYGANPTDYTAFLLNAEIGVSFPSIGIFNIGYELASSDNGMASYQFPLSTGQRLHRISDVFIDPPEDGLHNPYFSAECDNLFWGIGGWLGYHAYFSEEESDFLGQEIDVVLYRQIIPGLLRAEITYGSFFGEGPRFTDLHIFAFDLVLEL
ncbi:MAG: alginate export family protein [Bacteroidota bacterium]